ncbi:MAG TPA: hypothetical protein VGR37_12470 [Longimicrobiaceae bacterium]|nr:hypothetical protein [Longimicrobiaceae bacterium]
MDTTIHYAELTAFSLPVPNSDPNNILALAPEAQAEFVRGVAAHASTGRAIAAGIAAPIKSDSPPPGARNLARISRRVVFSIENRSPSPADRLHSVRIRMELPDSNMSYVSWDKIATKHNTVDVGTLSFTQGTEVGAELGLTLPVLSAAPKVSGSATSGMNESVTLRHRFVDLNGALTERQAILLQQSTAGIDLTGNVIADFVVDVEERQSEWFYAFSGDSRTCEQAVIRGEFNDIARSTRPRNARVTLEYVLRRVDGGDATITESDDVVSFVSAKHDTTVELIPESALIVNSWYVRTNSTPSGVLHLRSTVGGLGLERFQPVQFASYEDAERMVQWLRRCKGSIPGFNISIPGRDLDANSLYIDRVIANTDPIVGPKTRSPEQRLGQ